MRYNSDIKLALLLFIIASITACAGLSENRIAADSGYAALPLQGCSTDLRYLNQVLGWQTSWPSQWQSVVTADPASVADDIQQWSDIPESLALATEHLRHGIIHAETAPRIVTLRVHEQVQDLLTALSSSDSSYLFQIENHHNAQAWNRLIIEEVTPAIFDFEQFLLHEYLPVTRNTSGLAVLDKGESCFFQAVSWWTSLSLTQEEIEDTGWRVLNTTRKELAATGAAGETIDDILDRLRSLSTSNKVTAEAIIAISEAALSRAHDNTLTTFSSQASPDLVVTGLAPHLQNSFPAGRYVGADDQQPGRYIINPSRPDERRLMAEVIAFHEGIPGHHLWVTYPRTKPAAVPESGFAGLSEGWAIYAEYLADEMGLYSSLLDRQGMMAKHLWAASRLIVEPGLHLRGWSREEAIAFMLKNTVMSLAEIELEVDRYIAMPGQSLSYILGSELILFERERARELLGDRFDLKAFHDVVLGKGLRPLDSVRKDIRIWTRAELTPDPVRTVLPG